MGRPFVSLLTDFGDRDPFAAICIGVIVSICPEARVLEISRRVRPFAVRAGALALAAAVPYLPVGVHLAVVDPGVGTDRRPIAVRVARGDALVGPDNGLLLVAADRLGGAIEARVLDDPAYHRAPVSASFHGRDIFAPVAAHLAAGVPFERLGQAVPLGDLVGLTIPRPVASEGRLETTVVDVDGYGNAKLAGGLHELRAGLGEISEGTPLLVELTGSDNAPRVLVATWAVAFGRVAKGSLLVYEDSFGQLCLAENQGSAAGRLALAEDQPVVLRRG